MEALHCEEGDIIQVINTTLPLGRFLKIQPQSVDFLDIHDPKAVLEQALRQYSTITQGDIIPISYNSTVYRLMCLEVKPGGGGGVSIVETDLEVDFAPPVGYVEPSASSIAAAKAMTRQQSMASSVLSVDEHKVRDDQDGAGGSDSSQSRWRAFEGTGKRLNERRQPSMASASSNASSAVLQQPQASDKENNNDDSASTAAALRIPANKLWFGYKVNPLTAESKQQQQQQQHQSPIFEGKGFSLRRG